MKKFFNAVAKLALAVLVITAVIPLTPPVVKAAANKENKRVIVEIVQ